MDSYFYFSSIRSVTIQLMNIFSDIKIMKYSKEGKPVKEVEVPLKYSTKEAFYWWLYDKKQTGYLPMMSMHLTGLSYDSNRATQSNDKLRRQINKLDEEGNKKIIELLKPAPWKFSYQLNIASVYLNDMDQIIEQIIPFFSPFIMTNVKIPEAYFDYDAKIILGGLSQDVSEDISNDSYRLVKWTMDLNVDGFIMKPNKESNIIKEINIPYYIDKTSYVPGSDNIKLTDKININDNSKIYDSDEAKPEFIGSIEGHKNDIGKIISSYEIYKDDQNETEKD